MRKLIALILALTCVLGCTGMVSAMTVLSSQNLSVDGKTVDCEKYNIDGSNYFKLRDIAHVLNGTKAQFAVGWDATSQTISILTGEAYTANGSELDLSGGDKSATAKPSSQTLKIDGKTVSGMSVYNIGGNNYFKLRDLGDALGFTVGYNAETRTATVESGKETQKPVISEWDGTLPLVWPGESNTVSVGVMTNDVAEYENNAYTKWLEEQTGVDLQFVAFMTDERDAATQVASMIATGEKLPDILLGFNGIQRENAVKHEQDGHFVDLTPYFEKTSYYYKESVGNYFANGMETYYSQMNKELSSNGGKIIGFPFLTENSNGEVTSKANTYITADCENTVMAFKLLDFMCSVDNYLRQRWGKYGADWDYAEEGSVGYFGEPARIKILNATAFSGTSENSWTKVFSVGSDRYWAY